MIIQYVPLKAVMVATAVLRSIQTAASGLANSTFSIINSDNLESLLKLGGDQSGKLQDTSLIPLLML